MPQPPGDEEPLRYFQLLGITDAGHDVHKCLRQYQLSADQVSQAERSVKKAQEDLGEIEELKKNFREYQDLRDELEFLDERGAEYRKQRKRYKELKEKLSAHWGGPEPPDAQKGKQLFKRHGDARRETLGEKCQVLRDCQAALANYQGFYDKAVKQAFLHASRHLLSKGPPKKENPEALLLYLEYWCAEQVLLDKKLRDAYIKMHDHERFMKDVAPDWLTERFLALAPFMDKMTEGMYSPPERTSAPRLRSLLVHKTNSGGLSTATCEVDWSYCYPEEVTEYVCEIREMCRDDWQPVYRGPKTTVRTQKLGLKAWELRVCALNEYGTGPWSCELVVRIDELLQMSREARSEQNLKVSASTKVLEAELEDLLASWKFQKRRTVLFSMALFADIERKMRNKLFKYCRNSAGVRKLSAELRNTIEQKELSGEWRKLLLAMKRQLLDQCTEEAFPQPLLQRTRSGPAKEPAKAVARQKAKSSDFIDELAPGSLVLVHGLQKASEYNGLELILQEWSDIKGRWYVKMPDGSIKLMKPENLCVKKVVEEAAIDPESQMPMHCGSFEDFLNEESTPGMLRELPASIRNLICQTLLSLGASPILSSLTKITKTRIMHVLALLTALAREEIHAGKSDGDDQNVQSSPADSIFDVIEPLITEEGDDEQDFEDFTQPVLKPILTKTQLRQLELLRQKVAETPIEVSPSEPGSKEHHKQIEVPSQQFAQGTAEALPSAYQAKSFEQTVGCVARPAQDDPRGRSRRAQSVPQRGRQLPDTESEPKGSDSEEWLPISRRTRRNRSLEPRKRNVAGACSLAEVSVLAEKVSKKRVLCYYHRTGSCRRDGDCWYAHSALERELALKGSSTTETDKSDIVNVIKSQEAHAKVLRQAESFDLTSLQPSQVHLELTGPRPPATPPCSVESPPLPPSPPAPPLPVLLGPPPPPPPKSAGINVVSNSSPSKQSGSRSPGSIGEDQVSPGTTVGEVHLSNEPCPAPTLTKSPPQKASITVRCASSSKASPPPLRGPPSESMPQASSLLENFESEVGGACHLKVRAKAPPAAAKYWQGPTTVPSKQPPKAAACIKYADEMGASIQSTDASSSATATSASFLGSPPLIKSPPSAPHSAMSHTPVKTQELDPAVPVKAPPAKSAAVCSNKSVVLQTASTKRPPVKGAVLTVADSRTAAAPHLLAKPPPAKPPPPGLPTCSPSEAQPSQLESAVRSASSSARGRAKSRDSPSRAWEPVVGVRRERASAAAAEREAPVDCLTLAGHFEGRYVGERGETYLVTPVMPGRGKGKDSPAWRCVRDTFGTTKVFPVISYFPANKQIWWSNSYFMEVEDFVSNCDIVRWFSGSDPRKKLGPRFAWTRVGDSVLRTSPKTVSTTASTKKVSRRINGRSRSPSVKKDSAWRWEGEEDVPAEKELSWRRGAEADLKAEERRRADNIPHKALWARWISEAKAAAPPPWREPDADPQIEAEPVLLAALLPESGFLADALDVRLSKAQSAKAAAVEEEDYLQANILKKVCKVLRDLLDLEHNALNSSMQLQLLGYPQTGPSFTVPIDALHEVHGALLDASLRTALAAGESAIAKAEAVKCQHRAERLRLALAEMKSLSDGPGSGSSAQLVSSTEDRLRATQSDTALIESHWAVCCTAAAVLDGLLKTWRSFTPAVAIETISSPNCDDC